MNVSVNSNNSLHFFRTYLCAHLYTVYPFLWKLIFKLHFSMRFCEIKSHPEANGASTFFNCTERALNRQERCLHRTARQTTRRRKTQSEIKCSTNKSHQKTPTGMVWCYGREDTSRSGEATFARKIATTVSTDTPPFAATRHDKRFRFVCFTTASFMPSPTTPHNPTDRPFTYTHTHDDDDDE